MALEDIKSNLAQFAGDAWDLSDEEISDFRNTLRSTSSDLGVSDEFADCAEERDFQTCLEDWAEDNGLDDAFEGDWDDAPASIRDNLRNIRNAWGPEEREAARQIAMDADLDVLNRKCSRGQIDDVADQLDMDEVEEQGGPAQITNFRECVEAVSIAQDVSSALKAEWGTDGS